MEQPKQFAYMRARKVEFVQTRDAAIIPRALKLPFILGTMGVIRGEK